MKNIIGIRKRFNKGFWRGGENARIRNGREWNEKKKR